MGIQLSADEVLEVAERIESNGAAFYRRAADLRPESETGVRELLRRLAAMEDRHLATFQAIRRDLSARMREPTAADPFMEASLYLKQMADTHGGEGSRAPAEALNGTESVEELLRTGVRLEEKSVVFYVGLREMVPAKLGRDRIDAVILEEKQHIVDLARALRDLRKV